MFERVMLVVVAGLIVAGCSATTRPEVRALCKDDEVCDFECEEGLCGQACRDRSECTASCAGGGCILTCEGEASCTFDCDGGGCTFRFEDPDRLSATCGGGDCFEQQIATGVDPDSSPEDPEPFEPDGPSTVTQTDRAGSSHPATVVVTPPDPDAHPDAHPDAEPPPGYDFDCSGGGCDYACGTSSSCVIGCSGGGCNFVCGTSAECWFDCAGGGCRVSCGTSSECAVRCPSGDCSLTCGTSATCGPWSP